MIKTIEAAIAEAEAGRDHAQMQANLVVEHLRDLTERYGVDPGGPIQGQMKLLATVEHAWRQAREYHVRQLNRLSGVQP